MTIVLPTKSLALAAIVAWSGIAASVLTGQREHAPQAVSVLPAHFEQRWGEVAADNESVLKKQDRLVLPAPEPPTQKLRHVVPVPLDPATIDDVPIIRATPADEKQAEEEKTARKTVRHHVEREERHVERNVCTRHGMHKVITRGGKSWRCRR